MTSLISTWASSIANSYTSLTSADSFLAVSLYSPSDWTSASTTQREAALLRATRTIDTATSWRGNKKYSYMSLEFPRSYLYGNQSWPWSLATQADGTTSHEENIMKERVQMAQALQANFILAELDGTDEHLINQKRGIKSYSESLGGKLSESFSYGTVANRLCTEAMELLREYAESGAKLERG